MNPLVATTAHRAYGSWVGGAYTHEQDTVDFTSPKTRSFIIVRLNSFITKTHQFVTVAGDLAKTD